jgi:DMSO/TMAO reductase YedYZ molybdopterin-dependent catalytic subunit
MNTYIYTAYEMNGQPLPASHGYPIRLLTPGWYGMASVKWLTSIEIVEVCDLFYFYYSRGYF